MRGVQVVMQEQQRQRPGALDRGDAMIWHAGGAVLSE
jgi:phage gp45-like